MRLSPDLNADDFATHPGKYPGTPPPCSGLIADGRYRHISIPKGGRVGQAFVEEADCGSADRLNVTLVRYRVAPVEARQLVVAVGSNASPAVIRRKFSRAGVSTVVPFIMAEVEGIGVGHSAHVSIPGYVPAAPFLQSGRRVLVVGALLDADQLSCLDATEPNYIRRSVGAGSCRLELDGGEVPRAFWVYESRWGVLASPGGRPLDLMAQETLFELLTTELVGFSGVVGDGGMEDAMKRLADAPAPRDAVREAFLSAGWSMPTTLIKAGKNRLSASRSDITSWMAGPRTN